MDRSDSFITMYNKFKRMKNTKGANIKNAKEDAAVNLGLDADQSSEGPSVTSRLNDDNDRITGNPNGENDKRDDSDSAITSPLDEK